MASDSAQMHLTLQVFLDAITSPSTYLPDWVSQSVMFPDFGDSYRIYRPSHLVQKERKQARKPQSYASNSVQCKEPLLELISLMRAHIRKIHEMSFLSHMKDTS